MMRAALLLLALLLAVPAAAQPAGRRFVAVAFHDVVDRREDMDSDSVDSARLVRFFDWLKGTGWTPITLDDIEAAGQGRRPLPDKAILISFDDGYRSVYTRVFPLLLAYRFPAVIGLVGSWLAGPMDGMVRYGDHDVPRSNFLSWEQIREMQASGLVEVASHSYALHQGILANPQGNQIPAAMTWRYNRALSRYETDAEHRARIRADLEHARRDIAQHTGRPPRALIWPFGRYSGVALEAAKEAGFRFAFTLDPEPADAARPFNIPRYFPTRDPGLGEIADNLRFLPPEPSTVRVACLRLDNLAAAPIGPAQDAVLGHLIEALRGLGANTVVLDASAPRPGPDAPLGAVRFPTPLRPMDADVLSRAVWQLRTRGGVDVFVTLPWAASIASVGAAGVPRLFADMMRVTGADGIAVEAPGAAAPAPGQSPSPWVTQALRREAAPTDPATALVIQTIRAATAIEPRTRLMLLAPSPAPAGPPPFADLLVVPPPPDLPSFQASVAALRQAGWFRPALAGRVALSLPFAEGPAALREAQQRGAAGFALCPAGDGLPADPRLPPVFSAASFPFKP